MLMRWFDSRLLILVGLTIFATSCFMNTHLDANYAAPQLFLPDIIRAVGQALVMTPMSAMAISGISREQSGNASGLFNMLRNLGGAIGTAAIETFYTKREQYHSFIINQHVSLLEPATRNRLNELSQFFFSHGFPDPSGAMHRAIAAIGGDLHAQAAVMGYGDCFGLIGATLVVAALPVILLRGGGGYSGGAH
jgi:DHA2 family multidrug resistance protein